MICQLLNKEWNPIFAFLKVLIKESEKWGFIAQALSVVAIFQELYLLLVIHFNLLRLIKHNTVCNIGCCDKWNLQHPRWTETYSLKISGKAEGVLFEDAGDGHEYTKGGYLSTTYVAELRSSVVTVRVSKTDGLWKRPNRRLQVKLLLGKCALVRILPVELKFAMSCC